MYLDCKHPNSLGYDMRKDCWVVYEGAAVYTKECFSESVNARGRKEGREGGGEIGRFFILLNKYPICLIRLGEYLYLIMLYIIHKQKIYA